MSRRKDVINKYGLDLNRPNPRVIILLLLFLLSVLFLIYNKDQFDYLGIWKNLDTILFLIGWFGLLTTPLVDWLRNTYVFIGWLLFCLLWFYYKSDMDFFTAILPLCVLFYSQVSRLIFRWQMGYHPVHLFFNQYVSHRYSKLNKRNSTKIDFRYSVVYTVIGLLLSIVIGIINLK